jgi:cytochrome d ubiquinol oxidase subunit II
VALSVLAAVALIAAAGFGRMGRGGRAFTASALGIAAAVACLFCALYPYVLPSSTNVAYSLTTANAASTAQTLMVMTVVACIALPFVLAYQAWTYWVFRQRVMTPGVVVTGRVPGQRPAVSPPASARHAGTGEW